MKKKNSKKILLLIALIIGLVVLPITFARYSQVINKKITINVRKPNYIVYFNSNRDDGNADDVSSQSFVYGTSQTLQANTFTNGSLTFHGWNTERDGSGTAYTDEQEVTNLSSEDGDEIYLYAQWGDADYWVTYVYGDESFTGIQYLETGIGLFSSANINRDFEVSMGVSNFVPLNGQESNRNVIFVNQNESGTPYPGFAFHRRDNILQTQVNCTKIQEVVKNWGKTEGNIVFTRTDNKLYQDGALLLDFGNKITPFESSSVIGANLDENGNPRRFSIVDLSNIRIKMKYTYEEYVALYQNLPIPNRSSKIFVGWYTAPTGGTKITSQAQFEQAGGTIYARWDDAPNLTIIFNSNDGTNRTSTQTITSGVTTSLNPNTFTRDGYSFLRWDTVTNGLGTSYADGASVTIRDDMTLYAIWISTPKTSYTASSLTFNAQTSDIVDTGMYLFSNENIHKNFELSFEINSVGVNSHQATLLNSKDESGAPYPGFVFRKENNDFLLKGDSTANNTNSIRTPVANVQKLKLIRISDVVYYSINDAAFNVLMDYTNIVRKFDAPVSLGGFIKPNGARDRAFKGTISNVVIQFISDSATLNDYQNAAPAPSPAPANPDDNNASGESEPDATEGDNGANSISTPDDSNGTNENNNINPPDNTENTESESSNEPETNG